MERSFRFLLETPRAIKRPDWFLPSEPTAKSFHHPTADQPKIMEVIIWHCATNAK